MSQDIDYRRVRKYVDEHINKRKNVAQMVFFFVSLSMFILFNFIAWIGFDLGRLGGQAVGAGVMLAVGWGVSILYQFLNIMLNSKAAQQQMRESLTLRGMAQEMARLGMTDIADLTETEKPKRRETVRLSDDGELVNDAEADRPARKTSASER